MNKNVNNLTLLQKYFDTAFDSPNGIKELRGLILKLAMMGKLVSQDANDQPASELLKEIQSEKKKLLAEGKIKKQKPLPEIKPEEIPYALPDGWGWCRLGELGEAQTGTTPPTKDPTNFGNFIPFIGPGDIQNNKMDLNNKGLSKAGMKKSRIIDSNSILMVCIGGSIGKHVINKVNVTCNQQINTITPFIRNTEFLFYILASKYFQSTVRGSAGGSATPIINKNKWSAIVIPFPPLNEQKRIVEKINELMARCDEMERLKKEQQDKRLKTSIAALHQLAESKDKTSFNSAFNFITNNFSSLYSVKENVENLKKAILQLAMMGKLVPQDVNDQPASELLKEIQSEKKKLLADGKIKKQKPLPKIKPEEIPYELPDGWDWCRLNEAVDVRDGTHDSPKYHNKGIPLVTSKNLYTGTLNFDNVKYISPKDHEKIQQRSKVDKGDILFAMIGSIGNPVIVNTELEFSIKNVALFKYYKKNYIFEQYLYFFLLLTQQKMKDVSSGAVQNFVSLTFLRNYFFALPPLNEQKRIVAKINELMNLCDNMLDRIEKSERTQDKLLHSILAKE